LFPLFEDEEKGEPTLAEMVGCAGRDAAH